MSAAASTTSCSRYNGVYGYNEAHGKKFAIVSLGNNLFHSSTNILVKIADDESDPQPALACALAYDAALVALGLPQQWMNFVPSIQSKPPQPKNTITALKVHRIDSSSKVSTTRRTISSRRLPSFTPNILSRVIVIKPTARHVRTRKQTHHFAKILSSCKSVNRRGKGSKGFMRNPPTKGGSNRIRSAFGITAVTAAAQYSLKHNKQTQQQS